MMQTCYWEMRHYIFLLITYTNMKTTISLILALMYFLPIQTEAKVPYNSDFCDKIWNANFEMEVDGEFGECKNRFKWLINNTNSYFNHH